MPLKPEQLANAILTGSRVYGTPRPDSDVDLVVYAGNGDFGLVEMIADKIAVQVPNYGDYGSDTLCLRFGKLNLILESDYAKFASWRDGTAQLKARAPVTREEAVAHFKKLFACVEAERADRPGNKGVA